MSISVYEQCPEFSNNRFLLRQTLDSDVKDLLLVYSDKKALPFFNSDNCHGDIFYYPTEERMKQAIDFWKYSYEQKYFVRWSVIDKKNNQAIGTIELFHRDSDGSFDTVGLLRLDVRSDNEEKDLLIGILSLIVSETCNLFDCPKVATKCPAYAIERAEALKALGFAPSDNLLKGEDKSYDGYWIC